jgi:ADP-ribosylglycohydrolase
MTTTDPAAGIVVGSAFGDALGAGYEFGIASLPGSGPCQMIGGGLGNFAPGEWTDDTSMATAVLDAVAVYGEQVGSPDGLNHIAAGFANWYASGPVDIGTHTRQVLAHTAAHQRSTGTGSLGSVMLRAAKNIPPRAPAHVSNGALMRTAPVAVPWVGSCDLRSIRECGVAAGRVAALTHAEPTAVLTTAAWSGFLVWASAYEGPTPTSAEMAEVMSVAASAAAVDQRRDPAIGRDTLKAISWFATGDRIEPWVQQWSNSSSLGCMRDALASVYAHWREDPTGADDDGFFAAVDTAVKCGGDADTVAAVAGGLAGAVWGLKAVPDQQILHGYPGWTAVDLIARTQMPSGQKPSP